MKYSFLKYFLSFAVVLIAVIAIGFWVKDYNTHKNIKLFLKNGKQNELEIIISDKLKKELNNPAYSSGDSFVKPDDISKIIVIYADKHGFNDKFAALKIQIAAQNLGWESVIVRGTKNERAFDAYAKVINYLKPDFTINLHDLIAIDSVPNYLILHFPDEWLANTKSDNLGMYKDILNYDGFLLSFGDDRFVKPLQDYFAENNKDFIYDYFYFSVPGNDVKFHELDYKRLFFCGTRWDKRRGEDYEGFYNLLDKAGYFDVCGPRGGWKKYPNSYVGVLPLDHNILADKMRKSGVGLVLHSEGHYDQNIPSTRIFELSAASMMIISEDMKFIKDNFGDNVLYIDPSLPPEELFLEIDKHMKWIKANPEKAREMAANSNKIFQEKFILENLLLKVEKMHNSIQNIKE